VAFDLLRLDGDDLRLRLIEERREAHVAGLRRYAAGVL
jgi:hypothetical protein